MSQNYIPKVIKIKFMYILPQLKLSTFGKNVTTEKFKAIVVNLKQIRFGNLGSKLEAFIIDGCLLKTMII